MPISPETLSVRDLESIAGVRLKIEHTIPVEAFEIFYLDSRERGCDFIDIYTEIVSDAIREYIKRRLDQRIQATSHLTPRSDAKDRIESPAPELPPAADAALPSAGTAEGKPPKAVAKRVRRSAGVDRPRAQNRSLATPAPSVQLGENHSDNSALEPRSTAKKPAKKVVAKKPAATRKPKKKAPKK